MLCPTCGKEIDDSQKFCEYCGSSTRIVPNADINTSDNGNQQFKSISFDTPPVDYSSAFQPSDVQQTRGMNAPAYGTEISENNTGSENHYPDPYSAGPEPVKKKPFFTPKKIIIISVIALLVAVIGVMSVFLIHRKLERDYIVNNPTKSTFNSYQKYFEENNSDDPLYTILKNVQNTATLKVSASGAVNAEGQDMDFKASADLGYNKKEGRYYLKLDAGDIMKYAYSGESESQTSNGILEINQTPQNLYFNYDLFGSKGKYIIDNVNFRQAINDSIFSPDKDNVLKLEDKESFNQFVDAYENAVKELSSAADESDEPTELETAYENLIKIAEKNGNVIVGDGMATVYNGSESKDISSDIITYTYDYNSFKNLVTEGKDEIKSYLNKVMKDADKSKEASDSIEESFNSFIRSYEQDTGENFKLIVRIYLDVNTHSMIKTAVEVSGYDKENDSKKVIINCDFLKAPDNMIRINVSEDLEDSKNTAEIVISKTDDGTTVKYDFSVNSVSGENDPYKANAYLQYNRSTKDFTVFAGTSEEESSFTYTGKAEITENKIAITLNDVVKTDEVRMSLNIEFSSEAPAPVDTSGAKDFLKITKDEFEKMFEDNYMLSMLSGLGSSTNTDVYDYNSYKTDGDYYASLSDASTIDSSIKAFYSGVLSGTINRNTDPSITSLPEAGVSVSERSAAANKLTVEDALKYNGLEDLTDSLYEFGADSKGTVYSLKDEENSAKIIKFLSRTTELGYLYGS